MQEIVLFFGTKIDSLLSQNQGFIWSPNELFSIAAKR